MVAQVAPEVTLHVTEHGERGSSTHVLLVHGFPDDQRLWDPVVEALPPDWHVVTYDVRGAGRSSRPGGRAAYRTEVLVEDLVAVLDATVPPGRRVHLVGHDWGSTLGWEAVAAATWDPRLQERLAGFTSSSGPPLDHVSSIGSGWRGRLRMLPQLLHSWYVGVFLVPGIAELLWTRLPWLVRRLGRRLDPTIDLLPWGPDLVANARSGLNLYRANLPRRLREPLPWRTSLPVQLVVATRDAFVTPATYAGLEARCRDLHRVEVEDGHWLPRARPEELAALVTAFVRRHPCDPAGEPST